MSDHLNPLGIHAGVWIGRLDAASVRDAVEKTAAAGYDLLEVPATDVSSVDVDGLIAELGRHQLGASVSLGLTFDTDVSSDDAAVRDRGVARLGEALDLASAVGAHYLVGCLYSALGKYPGPATDSGRRNSAAAVRDLAAEAATRGIQLGLEVVNRYETNLFNETTGALRFLDEVGEDNVSLHLDTYHMNIEEPDLAAPVLLAGDRLGYVHIGESHRGYLGSGTVDWPPFFRALRQVGYAGPITFESFSSAVVDPALSNTLAVWRNLWTDNVDLAQHARRTIEAHLLAADRSRVDAG